MKLFASLAVASDEAAIAEQYPWAKSFERGINGHWVYDTLPADSATDAQAIEPPETEPQSQPQPVAKPKPPRKPREDIPPQTWAALIDLDERNIYSVPQLAKQCGIDEQKMMRKLVDEKVPYGKKPGDKQRWYRGKHVIAAAMEWSVRRRGRKPS